MSGQALELSGSQSRKQSERAKDLLHRITSWKLLISKLKTLPRPKVSTAQDLSASGLHSLIGKESLVQSELVPFTFTYVFPELECCPF